AQSREKRSEAGTRLREHAIYRAGHSERQRETERQRRAGISDRRRAAERIEKQRQNAEEGAEDIDDDVLADEVRVADGNLVSAAGRLELPDENRNEIERVVLYELLERERLRRLEERPVAGYRFPNSGVGEFHRDFIQLRRSEEEQRLRQNHFDEVERIGDLV